MLTRNRNLTEGFFISLLPPHNSYKDEQTNHHDDNYFCQKIKTTLFPAGTLSANTGQKNVWATCWRCFYQLSSSTNSVTIIHRFFCKPILTPKCSISLRCAWWPTWTGTSKLTCPSSPAWRFLTTTEKQLFLNATSQHSWLLHDKAEVFSWHSWMFLSREQTIRWLRPRAAFLLSPRSPTPPSRLALGLVPSL